MLLHKQALSLEELDSEVALELPDRETMQVVIIITDLIRDITVTVDVRNVNVAAQICAQLIATGRFSCEIQQ
jgi:hypothetical protein